MQSWQHIIHPLAPFYTGSSRVLILGSFPSVKSREIGFYYGHPHNRFWKVLAHLWGEAEPLTVPARQAFLLDHDIALYDTICECDIRGSSDASIESAVPADIGAVLAHAPIQSIYLNGHVAGRYYRRYQKKLVDCSATILPSTSSANARYRLADLIEKWLVILENFNRHTI